MQSNQYSSQQQIVQQALTLLQTLQGSQRPTELEQYIQNLARDQNKFEGIIQAIENQVLDEKSIKLLCLLVSKVLHSEDVEETLKFRAFMRLALNWSLPLCSKKMLEIELKKFIKIVSSQNLQYIFLIIERLQHLITDILQQREAKRQETSPIQMEGVGMTILVDFPQQFMPMVQSYLFLAQSVLYIQRGFRLMLEVAQNLKFFKNLHLIIFQPQNIATYPSLFVALFQFWGTLLQLFFNVSKLESFIDIVQNVEFLTDNIRMIYESLCFTQQHQPTDYFQMQNHPNASSLMKLKAQVCEFHLTLLSHMQNCKRKSFLFDQLSTLLPSLIKTSQRYLTTKLFEYGYQQDFLKNLLPLMSIAIEVASISKQSLQNLLVNLAIPYLQMSVQNAEYNQIVGQDLYLILDDCCQLQASGDLLSASAQLMQKILEKEPQLFACFHQIAWYSLRQRFGEKQESSGIIQEIRAMDSRVVFLGLSLSSYQDHQNFGVICQQLTELVSKQFLSELTASEWQYYFHFLCFSWVVFYQHDRTKLQILVNFALTPKDFKRQSLQFFALQFLYTVFSEQIRKQWLLKFIQMMPQYQLPQSVNRKWAIFHDVLIRNITDFEAPKIVWIVDCMRERVIREIERMELQKKQKFRMEYGEAYQYLSSLQNLQRRLGSSFMRRQIIQSLLDFVGLIDRAGHLNLQKQLVRIAINIFPTCQGQPQLAEKGLKVLQKIIITFIQHNYRGSGCLLAIFSGINAYHQEKSVTKTLLKILEFGSQFILKHLCQFQQNGLQRSILCLLCLLQKYMITVQLADLDNSKLQGIYERVSSACQQILQNSTANHCTLAAKYQVTIIVCNLLVSKAIDWKQFRSGALQGWFRNYDAFIILHSCSLVISQLGLQAKQEVLQISLLLLASHQLRQLEDNKQKKYTKLDLSRRRQPLDEIHRTVDAFIYEQSMAQQVWLLFQECQIKTWQDCKAIFPSFNQNCFEYLMFCRLRFVAKTEQQYSAHSKSLFGRSKQVQKRLGVGEASSQQVRKIVRVTGQRTDKIQHCDMEKTTFKRDISRHFINSPREIQEDSDSSLIDADQQQEDRPSKRLIDNYFTQHRTVSTLLNLSGDVVISKKESRRERMQGMIVVGDMRRMCTTEE